MSATHFPFGRVAVKSRWSRSRARSSAASSAIVVRRFLPRRTPSSPSCRISRATRSRDATASGICARSTCSPARRAPSRSARPRKRPAAPPRTGSPSPGRVELRREIHGRVLQDRVRTPKLGDLFAQPLQLLALLARQQVTPAAAVGLRLPYPHAQRFVVDAEITRDLPDRPARLECEPHRPLAQLQRILPRGSHDRSISFPQDDAWFGSL